LIAFVLIIFGINLLINGVKKNIEYVESKISFTWFKNNKTYSLIIFGTLIGFASGFTGMGSLLMMFFITGSGAIGHGFIGNFIFDVALIAGMGAVIGAASGSLIANRFDENKLGRLIGAILTIIGVIFMIKLFI